MFWKTSLALPKIGNILQGGLRGENIFEKRTSPVKRSHLISLKKELLPAVVCQEIGARHY